MGLRAAIQKAAILFRSFLDRGRAQSLCSSTSKFKVLSNRVQLCFLESCPLRPDDFFITFDRGFMCGS